MGDPREVQGARISTILIACGSRTDGATAHARRFKPLSSEQIASRHQWNSRDSNGKRCCSRLSAAASIGSYPIGHRRQKPMQTRKLIIANPRGLHAEACAKI